MGVSTAKRIFDIALCVLTIWIWGPVLIVCTLLNLVTNGLPVFYVSERRVHYHRLARITKFRAMVRNADKIANRDTIPVADTIFLNLPINSPLYTRVGRLFERLCLTELPQFLHVLTGQMSLIGNRPLPENIVAKLRAKYPYADSRFVTKSGMTGPVQLVGRDNLPDDQRLSLEIKYCRACLESYSMRLDFLILLYTVLLGFRLIDTFSVQEVEQLMNRYCRFDLAGWWDVYMQQQRRVAAWQATPAAAPARRAKKRIETVWASQGTRTQRGKKTPEPATAEAPFTAEDVRSRRA
jgi:lipopolysaccharide/colanic/teichoic acid biosynthesis glycosyltransferase